MYKFLSFEVVLTSQIYKTASDSVDILRGHGNPENYYRNLVKMRDQNFAYTFMHEFLPFENALTSEDEMTASVDK